MWINTERFRRRRRHYSPHIIVASFHAQQKFVGREARTRDDPEGRLVNSLVKRNLHSIIKNRGLLGRLSVHLSDPYLHSLGRRGDAFYVYFSKHNIYLLLERFRAQATYSVSWHSHFMPDHSTLHLNPTANGDAVERGNWDSCTQLIFNEYFYLPLYSPFPGVCFQGR